MWSYFNQFEVSFISYFAFSNENNSIKNDIMLPVFENLDGAYITSLLKLACEQKFRERVIPSNQITIEFLPQVLELVKKKEIYYKNKLIQIYLILLDLIENPNDDRYEELKVLVKNNYMYEEKEDQPLLYVFVLNYIAGELKKGRSKYINEAKDWVAFGLEGKMFLEEGYITPVVFSNMIRICCGTKNVESAENMIHNYAHTIKLKYRKDTLIVAQSYIYFKAIARKK